MYVFKKIKILPNSFITYAGSMHKLTQAKIYNHTKAVVDNFWERVENTYINQFSFKPFFKVEQNRGFVKFPRKGVLKKFITRALLSLYYTVYSSCLYKSPNHLTLKKKKVKEVCTQVVSCPQRRPLQLALGTTLWADFG